jgi:xylulokinase
VPLVLGVDSSTQSTKVEVRDADTGELVGAGRAPHPPTSPPRSEQDPEAWWRALVDAVAQSRVRRVDAVAVAGQQHGLVALDRNDAVIRPAKLWNDTESAADAAWLVEQLGSADAWARACGSVPVASFTITKLSWLQRTEPDNWKRLRTVLLPHDYLNLRLTGVRFTDRGDASGTGYWSPAEGHYRWDLLGLVDRDRDWSDAVPPVLAPAQQAGCVTAQVADELGLGEPLPIVAAGTGDNMAAALGTALAPGDVAVSMGTSGTVYTVAAQPTADASGAVAGFADATGRFLPLVCTLNATGVTDAVARLLGVGPAELDALALAASPGAGGLVLVPYLAGERTPNRPHARGALTGIASDVSRQQLARAAVEGVVCGLLDALDALGEAGVPTSGSRLVAVGGGSRSPAYRQVLADLSGLPVVVPSGTEHVATGACVQAAAALGSTDPLEVAIAWELGTGNLTQPDHSVDRQAVRHRFAEARG